MARGQKGKRTKSNTDGRMVHESLWKDGFFPKKQKLNGGAEYRMEPKLVKSKFIGSLLGTFIGDALGMPVEGYSATMIARIYGVLNEMVHGGWNGPGCYTDDTQMMIGVAESLVNCKAFDGNDLANRFVDNFDMTRGYGPGTMRVIMKLSEGYPWDQAGAELFDGGSYGNGAAMRIAPIGVFYHDDSEQLRDIAYRASMITHAHPLGMEGGAMQAYAIARAVRTPAGMLDREHFLNDLQAFARSHPEHRGLRDDVDIYHKKINRIQHLLEGNPTSHKVVDTLGNNITSFDSVPTSIYSFLAHHSSFEEAVVYAVNLGGDTDTIGAMTGAISGAYHGYENIPTRWLEKLENGSKGRDYVIGLAERLYEIWSSRNTTGKW